MWLWQSGQWLWWLQICLLSSLLLWKSLSSPFFWETESYSFSYEAPIFFSSITNFNAEVLLTQGMTAVVLDYCVILHWNDLEFLPTKETFFWYQIFYFIIHLKLSIMVHIRITNYIYYSEWTIHYKVTNLFRKKYEYILLKTVFWKPSLYCALYIFKDWFVCIYLYDTVNSLTICSWNLICIKSE